MIEIPDILNYKSQLPVTYDAMFSYCQNMGLKLILKEVILIQTNAGIKGSVIEYYEHKLGHFEYEIVAFNTTFHKFIIEDEIHMVRDYFAELINGFTFSSTYQLKQIISILKKEKINYHLYERIYMDTDKDSTKFDNIIKLGLLEYFVPDIKDKHYKIELENWFLEIGYRYDNESHKVTKI